MKKGFGTAVILGCYYQRQDQAARAAELSVEHGASWGFMHEKRNQHFPFHFKGSEDDPLVYDKLRQLTGSAPDRDEAASLTLAAWLSEQEMNGGGAAVDELSQLCPYPSEPLLRCTCSLHYGKQLCYNLGREANQRNLLSFFER